MKTLKKLTFEAHEIAETKGHSMPKFKHHPMVETGLEEPIHYYLSQCRDCNSEVVLKPGKNAMGGTALIKECVFKFAGITIPFTNLRR